MRSALPRLLPLLLACGVALPAFASPTISIIIDDMGNSRSAGEAALALPGNIAYAFLPEAPQTRRLATQAHNARREILVHLPLQPMEQRAHPLALSMTTPKVQRGLDLGELLASVPYATGVNNHQGSAATADPSQMHWLMRELARQRIDFFVDSRTTARSVAYNIARAHGIPSTGRQVFLDHEPGLAAAEAQFDRLLDIVQRHGSALAIGHPHPDTLQMLAHRLPGLTAAGIELVPPSELIRLRERPVPTKLRLTTSLDPRDNAGAAPGGAALAAHAR